MNRIQVFAAALAAASLTGCIVLPPPLPLFHRPAPPGFRGEGRPMPFGDARRPPPPDSGLCEARCAAVEPDAADALAPPVPGPR